MDTYIILKKSTWTGIALIIFAIFANSCTKHHYIPVESVKTEYFNSIKVDSVFVRDSIFLMIKGDTIIKESFRVVYKDRILRDSIFKSDTIRVPFPIEIVKYKNDYRTYIVLIGLFAIFIGVSKLRKFL